MDVLIFIKPLIFFLD